VLGVSYNALVKSLQRHIFFALLLTAALNSSLFAQTDEARPASFSGQSYRITLDVDFQEQSFVGHEVVRFTNSTRRDLDQINFHLYPNIGQEENEFPWLTVQGVSLTPNDARYLSKGQAVRFALRERNTLLQIKLPFKVAPGKSLELKIDFAARVPRIQREETTLLAHFLEEASDAMREEKQARDARDIFFACEQTMLLGYFYPILAAPETSSTEQGLAIGVGGLVISEVADYEVNVNVDAGVMVVASSRLLEKKPEAEKKVTHRFQSNNLRGFALVFGEHWKANEQKIEATTLATYFLPGDEAIGKKMMAIASRALATNNQAFGGYPYEQLNVVEMPLPAGFGGIEFPGLVALSQAYCVDFDAPAAARLPGLLREQADVIKNALEFTLAQTIAFQWWGSVVGSDSQRTPYLDEALAHFAATYYYEAAFGKEAGEKAINQNLRAPYQVYRSLGGVDVEVAKPTKEFRNMLQFSAIVQAKGAMLLHALRRELGDEQFFGALRLYFTTRKFRFATPNDLRDAFLAAAHNPAIVKALFQRYLREKRGDEDLGKPEVAYFNEPEKGKGKKIGRFFGKIGRAAARPF
jgi:aminopeptidase N